MPFGTEHDSRKGSEGNGSLKLSAVHGMDIGGSWNHQRASVPYACCGHDRFDLAMRTSFEEFRGGLEARCGNCGKAILHYETALSMTEHGLSLGFPMYRSKFLLLKAAGNAYRLLNNHESAAKCFIDALDLDDFVEARSIAACKLDYAEFLLSRGEYFPALELALEGVQYFGESDEGYRGARSHLLVAEANLRVYEDSSAQLAASRALAYYEKNGFEPEAVRARSILEQANVSGVGRLRRRLFLHLGRLRRAVLAVARG